MIYLAGPITGLSYEECNEWRDEVTKELNEQGFFGVKSPLRGKQFLKQETEIKNTGDPYADEVIGKFKSIVVRDFNDVKNCDVLFVNLQNAKRISKGTICEIAWAYQNQTPIIVVTDEGNVHEDEFINQMITVKTYDLDKAIGWVLSYFDQDSYSNDPEWF